MRRNVFRHRGMTDERRLEIVKMEAIAAHFKALADAEEQAGVDPDGRMFVETKRGGSSFAPLYERKP